jgi:hypothetical protein
MTSSESMSSRGGFVGVLASNRLWAGLLTASFALLLLVGVAGPSAAKPGLGPRGWAPGDLPWSPTSALVTAILWVAYGLGALGVGGGLLRGRATAAAVGWRWPLLLALLALATSPFGSADHTNYAAYGRIAAQGGDPYLTPPIAWAGGTDPVTSLVEPPWTDTVSVYGPFATLLQSLCSHLGGASMRETVWCWQVLVVLCWLGVRALLLRTSASPRRIDVLWTLNPVVFGIGVLGGHVDLLASALALGAVVAATRSPLLAGALAGLAVSSKVTFGAAGLAVLIAWWTGQRREFPWRAVRLVVGALVVAVPLHLWAGPHVYDQLGAARRSISLATPWRLVYRLLAGPLGGGATRTLISWLAVALALVLLVVLARATRRLTPATTTGQAARWTLVVSTAYSLAAPYSLPWYDLLTWATLPVLAASALDALLLVRLTAMAVAYVPGRVHGMSAAVERVTLLVRKDVVPYAVLLVWGWLTLVGAGGWRRSSGTRPPARARSPR